MLDNFMLIFSVFSFELISSSFCPISNSGSHYLASFTILTLSKTETVHFQYLLGYYQLQAYASQHLQVVMMHLLRPVIHFME